MGCNDAKETNYPTLLCFFETGNEEQKDYCIKVKDNFQHERAIRFEIKSSPGVNFAVKFKINGKIHDIQESFDPSDFAMNQALEKMYKILDENKK